jgi:serine/threonine protein kinase
MPDNFYLPFGKSIQSEEGTWYKAIQYLGSGGNAITYLVVATSGVYRGAHFAAKIFRNLSQQDRRDRFLEEISVLDQLSHPCIMRTYDAGLFKIPTDDQVHEHPFVIAEYLPQTLADAIRSKTLSMAQRCSIAIQLTSALNYLSDRAVKIIHRDIKPQNIFLKGDSCVLGDFGLMKLVDGNTEVDRDIFKHSVGAGMPFFYRTPDLVRYARNEMDVTVKSDVFQLGLVLCELFTGKNPCRVPQNILDDVELNPMGHIPGAAGAGIAALLKRMLVIDPTQRETIDAFLDPFLGVFQDVATRAHDLDGHVL